MITFDKTLLKALQYNFLIRKDAIRFLLILFVDVQEKEWDSYMNNALLFNSEPLGSTLISQNVTGVEKQ